MSSTIDTERAAELQRVIGGLVDLMARSDDPHAMLKALVDVEQEMLAECRANGARSAVMLCAEAGILILGCEVAKRGIVP